MKNGSWCAAGPMGRSAVSCQFLLEAKRVQSGAGASVERRG